MTIKVGALTGANWFKSSYSNDQGGACVEGARLADLDGAAWFKSSYSNGSGGECVEGACLADGFMAVRDSKDPHGPALLFSADAWRTALGRVDWFKSSYSDNQGGNCMEGARLAEGFMAVRDSKDPHGPALLFSADAWRAFISVR